MINITCSTCYAQIGFRCWGIYITFWPLDFRVKADKEIGPIVQDRQIKPVLIVSFHVGTSVIFG